MKIVIVGGGKVGEALAKLLVKEKHDVVIIEKDEKRAETLAEKIDALILHGDGSESAILKDADIDESDAVIAMTGDDKTNLMICEIAKSSKIPNIVARINDTTNEGVFMKIGISSIINTTNSAVLDFKQAIERPGKILSGFVAGEKAEVFEIVINEKSRFIGKAVNDAAKKFSIAAINRNGELIIPTPKTKLREGDIITICAPLGEVKRIEKEI
ncbi:MAG: NAD(P)-binding domain-containing protein [Candidatus Micrarchaeota archaeon]|nr:NAD(P)-binding domain-containing protein [Candidatus Micrarchaeota archaeon]